MKLSQHDEYAIKTTKEKERKILSKCTFYATDVVDESLHNLSLHNRKKKRKKKQLKFPKHITKRIFQHTALLYSSNIRVHAIWKAHIQLEKLISGGVSALIDVVVGNEIAINVLMHQRLVNFEFSLLFFSRQNRQVSRLDRNNCSTYSECRVADFWNESIFHISRDPLWQKGFFLADRNNRAILSRHFPTCQTNFTVRNYICFFYNTVHLYTYFYTNERASIWALSNRCGSVCIRLIA